MDDRRAAERVLVVRALQRQAAFLAGLPPAMLPVVSIAWATADRARVVGWFATLTVSCLLSAGAALLTARRAGHGVHHRLERLCYASLVAPGSLLGWSTSALHTEANAAPAHLGMLWAAVSMATFLIFATPTRGGFLGFSAATLVGLLLAVHDVALDVAAPVALLVPVYFTALLFGQHQQQQEALGALTGELASRRLAAEVNSANLQLASANAELGYRATHDPLTGLVTREVFLEAAQQAIDGALRAHRLCAVLLIDVDRFKTVNDALGHAAGDQVLVQIAERLDDALAGQGLGARHGGDEFTVLLPEVSDSRAARDTADRLRSALARPWLVDGQPVSGTVSIGLALSTDPSDTAADLLRHADSALYRVKDAGRDDVQVFDQTLRDSLRRRVDSETELREALAAGQVTAWFQPIVDLRNGRIVGAEALARWLHPQHGVVPPGRFLPLLEDAGLLPALSREITRQVYEFRSEIARLVPDGFRVALNVGVRDQALAALLERIARQAELAGTAPTGITLEITETAVINDIAAAAKAVAQARGRGFAVVLDDFGTGYSSLSLLRDLELDGIKIDRSFVAGMGQRRVDAAVVAGILGLARSLELSVVAEGVESAEEAERLVREGAVLGQGFRYSPAVPADAFVRLLNLPGQTCPIRGGPVCTINERAADAAPSPASDR